MDVDYGRGVKLLCYADDFALLFQRWERLERAPLVLARLGEKCAELGMKEHGLHHSEHGADLGHDSSTTSAITKTS